MKIDDIFYKYLNDNPRKREIGRYWASELNSILKGYSKPEDFLKPRKIEGIGMKMCLTGMAYEDMLTKIFEEVGADCKTQEKIELKIEDITLVVKTDYVFPEFVIEAKHPFSEVKEVPIRYQAQLEATYRAFNKPVFLGIFSAPYNLKLIPYKPSEIRWNNIKNKLLNYHEQVKQNNI